MHERSGSYIPGTSGTDVSQTERKTRQYEELLAQQRRIQAQMAMIDPETRREVDEQQKLEQDITMFTTGHLSEPTTPPDYYSSVNRVHSARLSTASIASPPGFPTRPSRSGSQLTSPHAAFSRPVTSHTHTSSIPSRSVPASRRGSDEDEEENAYSFADINHRAAAKYVQISFLFISYCPKSCFHTSPPSFRIPLVVSELQWFPSIRVVNCLIELDNTAQSYSLPPFQQL